MKTTLTIIKLSTSNFFIRFQLLMTAFVDDKVLDKYVLGLSEEIKG